MKTAQAVPYKGIEHDEALYKSIADYQNAAVIARYKERHPEYADRAEKIWLETKRFLYLLIVSRQRCAPSHVIDTMWHMFILHTDSYIKFCNRFAGRYVHHEPSEKPEVAHYMNARNMATAFFGQIDDTIWVAEACCSKGACV